MTFMMFPICSSSSSSSNMRNSSSNRSFFSMTGFALAASSLLLGSSMTATVAAETCSSVPFDLPAFADTAIITLKGYKAPTIKRFVGNGGGNQIVVKNYVASPEVSFSSFNTIDVLAGEVCSNVADPTASPTAAPAASTAFALSAFSFLSGGRSMGTITSLLFGLFMSVNAQDTCSDVEIEIHQDYADLINYDFKSGQYNDCPPETMYWKHHPLAFGGYEGCVSEKYLYPCPQDNEGMRSESLYSKYPYNWDSATNTCVETGYTFENRTFWTVSGDPLDKYELVKRTGLNPTVTFPFLAGPYPSYTNGPGELETDDTMSAKKAAYDFQVYLGAFKEENRDDWYVSWTEGAESGMVITFAAMALDIARTTCNRDLYVFNEVPSYGYSTRDAAAFANRYSSSFYEGPECACTADASCKDPNLTITFVGWLPGTPIPIRTGGDGVDYPADSSSAASPWFESIVFPENPSGVLKTPRLPNTSRRVCDGVYLWPMYFGTKGNVIPIDDMPDCATWAFAITKAYSASVRAGYLMYKKEYPTVASAVATIVGSLGSLTYGSLSQWTWLGQMQLWDMMMSRPVDDPTSWVGAYGEIMKEKWDAMVEGFAECPMIEITNPHSGAYAWLKMNDPYLGVQPGSAAPTFFLQVLGVQASTHWYVFRGADPADYYGPGYGLYDFVRVQLYRDLQVYKEIARRAKIVCADLDASIGDFISVNTWYSVARRGVRHLNTKTGLRHTVESRRAELMRENPELNEAQAQRLAETTERTLALDEAMEKNCSPEYTSSCIMAQWNHFGGRDF